MQPKQTKWNNSAESICKKITFISDSRSPRGSGIAMILSMRGAKKGVARGGSKKGVDPGGLIWSLLGGRGLQLPVMANI